MRIGLFFGSFNPVHTGHLIIANFFAENTDVQQVWFVISPLNPFKQKKTLLSEKHRYYMVNMAVEDNPKLKASNIEFHLPQPNYTIDTLTYLKEKYPQHQFVLLMGSDNLQSFTKWKNYEKILEEHPIYVYKRSEADLSHAITTGEIKIFDVPLLGISSTYIREAIKQKKSVRYLLPETVWEYLTSMHFYEK